MSHTSPATFLVWAVISTMLGIFLVFHLWSFDRFKCLKWNNGPYSGAFKRIMTYSYLISVPLLMTYSIGFAVIKYKEGFVALPFFGVVPKPYQLWDKSSRNAITPLMLAFSVAWSLEMVTHLEELCFWLFLVNAGHAQQDWFRSLYFKAWVVGSTIAVIYMPLITILTRADPLQSEAYTFLAGSLGSLSLTLWFLPVLFTFPSFLRGLKADGVDSSTIVRLTKFSELNTIRVLCRFLMVLPLLILGIDGVRPHHHINENMMWTDFLGIVAGFGCAVSSAITLVIFFPRSIEGEIANRDAARERRRTRSSFENRDAEPSKFGSRMLSQSNASEAQSVGGTYLLTSSPVRHSIPLPSYDGHASMDILASEHHVMSPLPMDKKWASGDTEGDEMEERDIAGGLPKLTGGDLTSPNTILRPNRRRGHDVELGGVNVLSEGNLSMHNLSMVSTVSRLNPMVHNFTSPIDVVYRADSGNDSRLTFNPRRAAN